MAGVRRSGSETSRGSLRKSEIALEGGDKAPVAGFAPERVPEFVYVKARQGGLCTRHLAQGFEQPLRLDAAGNRLAPAHLAGNDAALALSEPQLLSRCQQTRIVITGGECGDI